MWVSVTPSAVPFGTAFEFGLEKSHLLWRQASESVGQMSLPVTCHAVTVSFSQLDRQCSIRLYVRKDILRSGHQCRRHDPKGLPFSVSSPNSVSAYRDLNSCTLED
jgi:hypothetical protein